MDLTEQEIKVIIQILEETSIPIKQAQIVINIVNKFKLQLVEQTNLTDTPTPVTN